MTWLLVIGAAWVALAVLVGWAVGRSIQLADRRQPPQDPLDAPDGVPADWADPQTQSQMIELPAPRRPRSRRERR